MTNRSDYKYINPEYIYDLADGDNDFVVEIIGSFLESIGPNLQKLSVAITNEDKQTTVFLAHKLRGSFKFIGCNDAGETVGQIEDMINRNEPIVGAVPFIDAVEKMYTDIQLELSLFQKEINA